MQLKTIEWKNGRLRMLDQNRLPHRERYFTARTANDVHEAIRQMRVRGAPLIGIAAAYGLYLASLEIRGNNAQSFLEKLKEKAEHLAVSRPTAVNLGWALEHMMRRASVVPLSVQNIRSALLDEAKKIHREDIETNRKIGENMLALLHDGMSILTHCNAGALATAGYGTALSALYLAKEKGWDMKAYVDETRPRLQGAMLTAWELTRAGIDVTLITDSMAAAVMSRKKVDAVLVGCDRMAANGDMANKVGTLGLSITAKHFGIPFYVALPISSIDFLLNDGNRIPIEERSGEEITHCMGRRIAPKAIKTYNPAFDVTPHENITAIVTEKGIAYPLFEEGLKKLIQE